MPGSDHPHAFQDSYPDALSYCYGCGRLNEHGLQLRTFWAEGSDETVSIFQPRPYHIAVPGYVYGGLIASLFDCHGTGTASAAMARARGLDTASDDPGLRFVTASLQVDFLKPTPLGPPLEVRGIAEQVSGRKVSVIARLLVNGQETARARILAVQMPASFLNPD